MPEAPEAERTLSARIAAHTSWANTTNRSARTANARAALDAKFLAEAGGDPARAAHLRKAYFARLALKSAQARRRKAGARVDADDVYQIAAAAVKPAESLERGGSGG